jgi:hypothetical protein
MSLVGLSLRAQYSRGAEGIISVAVMLRYSREDCGGGLGFWGSDIWQERSNLVCYNGEGPYFSTEAVSLQLRR